MKLGITERTNLNEKMLAEEFELTTNPKDADFLISQSSIIFPQYLNKTIYIAIEPPLAEHRIWCYSQFDKCHTVIAHNPDPKKDNQFPYTKLDQSQFYPTRANPYEFVTREDTTLRGRGVFYAGMVGFYENQPDSHGGINITQLRTTLGNYFKKEFPTSKIIGNGWGGQKVKVGNWREDKIKQIKESECDFVLALENTIFPNYLYEKIWDGITNDRVTMYLGDSNIEKHIPLKCFIDLRPYFNKETKYFNCEALGKMLKEMTQEEYDEILNNARKFRETSRGHYIRLQDELTHFIIDRIKNDKKMGTNQ